MTTIYLIRHAEAEGNVFRRLQGQYNSMITPNGHKQIAALAQRFADVHIDAVYSSDLVRTCTTAGAIYRPKNLPLHTDPRFRELCTGVWENLPFGYLDHIDHERNYAFSHSPRIWQVEGSEPFSVYTGRFMEALNEVARKHEGQSVAIFSHGMVMRGVLQTMFFPERDNLGHSENTAVTKLLFDGKEFTLEYLNDASHIPHEISTLGRQQWWRGDGKKDFNMWFRDPTEADGELLSAMGLSPADGATVRISMLVERPTGAISLLRQDADTMLLQHLTLLEAHRGIGLSAQLIGEAVSIARKAGCQWLVLSAEPTDPAAVHLFAAYGFKDGRLYLVPTVV